MRVMVIIKANKDSEAGLLPDEKFLGEMMKYNEELVAGVMLAGEGLHPSSKGRRDLAESRHQSYRDIH